MKRAGFGIHRWVCRVIIIAGVFTALTSSVSAQVDKCLPDGVSRTTVSRYIQRGKADNSDTYKKTAVTVGAELSKLGARCRSGKLKARNGREIRFYELKGCWGNPPENYEAILADQKKEIAELKKKYLLVELTCEQDGPVRP